MELRQPLKSTHAMLNNLAERIIWIEDIEGQLSDLAQRDGLSAGFQSAILHMELTIVLFQCDHWHGLCVRSAVELGTAYRCETRSGPVRLTVYRDRTRAYRIA